MEKLAEKFEKRLPLEALDWFEQEGGNWVDIAQQLHNTENWDQLVSLGFSLGKFFDIRAHWSDWEKTHLLALNAARKLGNIHDEGGILNNLGNVYSSQSRWNEAISCYEQSLKIFRELGDIHGQGKTLMNLGLVYQSQERWNDAIDNYEQSLKICRELGDRHGEGMTLVNLGLLYKNKDKVKKAMEHWQNALTKLHPDSPKVREALQIAQAKLYLNLLIKLIFWGIAVYFVVTKLLAGPWALVLVMIIVSIIAFLLLKTWQRRN